MVRRCRLLCLDVVVGSCMMNTCASHAEPYCWHTSAQWSFGQVELTLLRGLVHVEDFNQLLLQRVHTTLNPFLILVITTNNEIKWVHSDAMAMEPHFLGCFHSFVSQFLQIQFGGDRDKKAKSTLLQKFKDILEKLVLRVCHFLPALLFHLVNASL